MILDTFRICNKLMQYKLLYYVISCVHSAFLAMSDSVCESVHAFACTTASARMRMSEHVCACLVGASLRLHVQLCMFAHVCACVRMHVHICACVGVYLHVHVFACMFVCGHKCARICAHTK